MAEPLILGGAADAAAAWLLTYVLHSTALLGGVWLVARARRVPDALRDTLWKAALVGGIATASLPLLAGWRPAGSVELRAASTAPSHATAPAAPFPSPEPASARPVSSAALVVPAEGGAAEAADAVQVPWTALLVGAWMIGAAFSLLRMAVARARFRRSLGVRSEVEDGELREALDRLCRDTGFPRRVRLTCSAGVDSPVALLRGEVCVPPRALAELDAGQRRSMLAHELGHLLRRDPAWLVLASALERVFFFQPLNRVARRRLHEASERLCDDWAVRQTGSALAMAECLAAVAAWVAPAPRLVPVAGMAGSGPSPLVDRVQRLLRAPAPRSQLGQGPARAAAAAVCLATVAALAPAISTARAEAAARPGPADRASSPSALAGNAARTDGIVSKAGDAARSTAAAPLPVEPPLTAPEISVQVGIGDPPCGDDDPDVLWIDGDHTVRWRGEGCDVAVRAREPLETTADGTDVLRLGGRRAYLVVEARTGSRARVLEIRRGGGDAPARTWRVDGRLRPYDAEGHELLRQVLPLFLRHSGVGARSRGADAAARQAGDRADSLDALLDARPDAGALRRIVAAAAEVAPVERRGEILLRAAREPAFGSALVPALLEAAVDVTPESDLADVLSAAADAAAGDPALLARVLRASEAIESGRSRSRLLAGVAARHPLAGEAREAYLRAAGSIPSERSRGRALTALLARGEG